MILLSAVLLSSANAAAQGSEPAVDGDALLVARLEPSTLLQVWSLLRSRSQALEALSVLIALTSRGLAGSDLTTTAGWTEAGFSADQPVWISLARAVPRAGRALPLWHSRAQLPISDAGRILTTLRALGRSLPEAVFIDAGAETALQTLMAAPSGAGVQILSGLRRRGVVFVAVWRQQLVVVRRDAAALRVDALAHLAGGAWTWRHRSALWQALDRVAKNDTLTRATAALPEGPAIFLWSAAEAVWRDGSAVEQANFLAYGMRRALPPRCKGFARWSETIALENAALVISPQPKGLALRLSWGLRDEAIARVLATAHHRTPQLTAHGVSREPLAKHASSDKTRKRVQRQRGRAAAAVTGAVHLQRPGALRSLQRPAILGPPIRGLRRAIAACGATAAVLTYGFGWLELAGKMLDDIASINNTSARLVDGLGPASFAVWQLASTASALIAAGELSLADAAAADLQRLFAQLFGASRIERLDGRETRLWGTTPVLAFQLPQRHSVGAATGVGALRRWLGRRPRPVNALASLHVDLEMLAEQLGAHGDHAFLYKLLASLASLDAKLIRRSNRLELDAAVSF